MVPFKDTGVELGHHAAGSVTARPGHGPHFAQVPWVLQDDCRADAATISTYAALQRFSDFGQDTGCRVSDAVAAKKAGLSRRAFISRRARLREMGWLSWESGKDKGSVNTYVVRRSLQREGVQNKQTPVRRTHTQSAPSADPGMHHVQTTNSHSTQSQNTKESTTRAAPRAEVSYGSNPDGDNLGIPHLMGLVRTHLYVPDGRPPDDWDISRDVSIIKALRRRYADRDIEVAIIGLSLLRDFPGVYGDPVEWLRNGGKVTLRALHNTRSGVLSMIERAKQAYWKQQNSRSKIQDRRNFERLGEVLRHTAQRAS